MIDKIKAAPEPLQRLVITRFAMLVITTFALIAMQIVSSGSSLMLSTYVLAAYINISVALLIRRVIRGGYVVVEGICKNIEYRGLRRYIKTATLDTEAGLVEIVPQNRRCKLLPGTKVTVYIAKNATVTTRDDVIVVHSYLAIGGAK